jgi:hypothetical protein
VLRASATCEAAGYPTASLTCEGFMKQAAATAIGLGLPNIPLALVPGHIGNKSAADLRRDVLGVTAQQVIENLTVMPQAAGIQGEPGARDIVVVNRTFENAQSLAGMVGGRAAAWDTLHVEAAMADVVIVATGSEVPVVEAAALRRAREACATSGYALLMMDLSVPRNIDPAVTDEMGITLIDLDTLHQPLVSAEGLRRDAVPYAKTICTDETDAFMEWLATMPARDAIKPLREALEGLAARNGGTLRFEPLMGGYAWHGVVRLAS